MKRVARALPRRRPCRSAVAGCLHAARPKGLPFCDMSCRTQPASTTTSGRVPLAAKAAMMVNEAAPFDELHIPAYQWGSEGLHGPLQPCVCTPDNRTCKCPTSFPCPSALGAAFNDSLYFLIGQADGREARAINNLRDHATQNVYGDGIDYWSPTINMQRDPRWGRNQEVPGEDPTLTAIYATQFVRGLQGTDAGSTPTTCRSRRAASTSSRTRPRTGTTRRGTTSTPTSRSPTFRTTTCPRFADA